jgi:predicted PP-loop superfamily ATPase
MCDRPSLGDEKKAAGGPDGTYRCPCCGKEHSITPAMIQAAISGLLTFSRDDLEEDAAIELIQEILSAR